MEKKEASTPPIYAIVAMAKNRVIGSNNQLPWHLPADLRHFKNLTTGSVIIMGRKTYEAIGNKLPNRINIIVTRDVHYNAPGCLVAHSLEEGIQKARHHPEVNIFVIGGSEIYKQAMPYIQKIYLTVVNENFNGDAYFPELNDSEWHETHHEQHAADEKNKYSYDFIELERR